MVIKAAKQNERQFEKASCLTELEFKPIFLKITDFPVEVSTDRIKRKYDIFLLPPPRWHFPYVYL